MKPLNLDGNSIGNLGLSGFGGVIRDSNFHFIIGYVSACGVISNLNVEIQAIYHGLKISWSKGLQKFIYEFNSTTSLELISHGVLLTHPLASLVDMIRFYIAQD